MSRDISVIVCTYTMRRWDALRAGIAALQTQTLLPRQILVVVDHEPALLARVRAELDGTVGIAGADPAGLAASRNSGVGRATGSIVAFLDDDALPDVDWLERLAEPYEDDDVIAVGGAVSPRWSGSRPAWFPPEFDWVVGCSYRGLPRERAAVRNLIGANMSFRREVFERVQFFSGLGHAHGRSLGGEETDLCIRLAEVFPRRLIVYEPRAHVQHLVPPERAGFDYYVRRCYSEGRSKGVLTRRVGSGRGLATERAYARGILPRAALGGLAEAVQTRQALPALRAGVLLVGLATATAGYGLSRLRRLSTMSS